MAVPSLGFIGGGRIVRVLLQGWARAGISLGEVVVCDPADSVVVRLLTECKSYKLKRGDYAMVGGQDILFVAVHPPAIAEMAAAVAKTLRAESIVVSLAPKFTIAKLAELFGGFLRIARVIPNAPSLVGRGFNPVAWSESLREADRQVVRQLLAPLGESPEVAEGTLEAYAVVAAMGPTYFWPQWEELAALGQEFGLADAGARKAVCAMLLGAVATLFDSGLSPAEVMDLVPVQPLGEFEPTLREAYRTRLPAIMNKIRP